jgi:hypothetical protein
VPDSILQDASNQASGKINSAVLDEEKDGNLTELG